MGWSERTLCIYYVDPFTEIWEYLPDALVPHKSHAQHIIQDRSISTLCLALLVLSLLQVVIPAFFQTHPTDVIIM